MARTRPSKDTNCSGKGVGWRGERTSRPQRMVAWSTYYTARTVFVRRRLPLNTTPASHPTYERQYCRPRNHKTKSTFPFSGLRQLKSMPRNTRKCFLYNSIEIALKFRGCQNEQHPVEQMLQAIMQLVIFGSRHSLTCSLFFMHIEHLVS